MNTFQEIWDKLKTCNNVILSLHYRPDGDSLGSCTALKYVLERDLKIKVDLVSKDKMGEDFDVFSFINEVQFGKTLNEVGTEDYDAVVYLDFGSPEGKFDELKSKKIFSICIDHHSSNKENANLNYIDTDSPAACSILVDMYQELGINFDNELCKRLMLGILTDTGFFNNRNSPSKAMKQVSYLIEHGKVNYVDEFVLPLKSSSLKHKKLEGIILSNFKIKNNFGYSILRNKDVKILNLNESEIRGGISTIKYTKGLDFVFTLTELNGYIKGSFRSITNVDVNVYAEKLGGGGHKPAAAFILKDTSLKEALQKTLKVIKEIGIKK